MRAGWPRSPSWCAAGSTDDDERELWAFDPWDAVAAEVAAALDVGHRRASGQMRIAVALRDRLPTVAALLSRAR